MNGEKNYLVHFGVKGMKWKNHTYKSIIGGEYIYDQVSNMAADLKKQGLSHEEIKTQIRSTMGQQRSQAANNSSAGNYSQAAQRAEQRIQQEKTQQAAKTNSYASEVANARAKAAQDAVAKEKELAVKAEERTARLAKEKEEKKAQEEARRKAAEEAAAKEEAEKAAKKAKKGSGKKGSSKKGSSSKKKTEEKKTETTDEELEDLANKVISGVYGNGAQRKAALGDRYQEVQRLVNEKLKGGKSSTSQTGTSKQETTEAKSTSKVATKNSSTGSNKKSSTVALVGDKDEPDFEYEKKNGKYVLIDHEGNTWSLNNKPSTAMINQLNKINDHFYSDAGRKEMDDIKKKGGSTYEKWYQSVSEAIAKADDQDKKTESQIRSAHQGDVSRSKKVKHSVIMNDTNYIEHHGILGQRWGVRRYQNPDGTLTPAGVKRYTKWSNKEGKRVLNRKGKKMYKATMKKEIKEVAKKNKELMKRRSTLSDDEIKRLTDRFAAEKKLKDAYANSSTAGRFKDQIVSNLSKKGADALTDLAINVAVNTGMSAIEKQLNGKLKNVKLDDYVNTSALSKAASQYKKELADAKMERNKILDDASKDDNEKKAARNRYDSRVEIAKYQKEIDESDAYIRGSEEMDKYLKSMRTANADLARSYFKQRDK